MDCHEEVRQGWETDAQAARQANDEAEWRARCIHAAGEMEVEAHQGYPLVQRFVTLCDLDNKYAWAEFCRTCKKKEEPTCKYTGHTEPYRDCGDCRYLEDCTLGGGEDEDAETLNDRAYHRRVDYELTADE